MKIEFYPEICCEDCNEIIHNHFDCPVCNKQDAGTSIYGEPWDETEFRCENCDAKFVKIQEEWEVIRP